jgi:hypothetical protein
MAKNTKEKRRVHSTRKGHFFIQGQPSLYYGALSVVSFLLHYLIPFGAAGGVGVCVGVGVSVTPPPPPLPPCPSVPGTMASGSLSMMPSSLPSFLSLCLICFCVCVCVLVN